MVPNAQTKVAERNVVFIGLILLRQAKLAGPAAGKGHIHENSPERNKPSKKNKRVKAKIQKVKSPKH